MELSPEERQRIYLEEKARLAKKPGCSNRALGCGVAVVAAILLLVGISLLAPRKPAAGPSEVTVSLTAPLLCSKGLLGLDTAAQVRAASDVLGIAGLVARDKALVIPAGSVVHVVNHSADRASLYVRSGALVGEDCWIHPAWITAATQ